MRKIYSKSIILGVLLLLTPWLLALAPYQLTPNSHMVKITMSITEVIRKLHYRQVPLDDALSAKILKRYLETLDPNRNFFTKRDIDRFKIYKTRLDDNIRNGDTKPAFVIFKIYRKRVNARINYALKLLKRKFNFKRYESYQFDRTKAPWPHSQRQANDLWRKRVKNDFLSLRLAGKTDAAILKVLQKRYQNLRKRVNQFNAEDVFQLFINAYTLSLEPHTSYMSPSSSENFDISMRLSLEGIGAVLRASNDYTVIQKVIPGGPAELSRQIHRGDKIFGVAQGLNGPMEDVVGWRLQDVVNKIRGRKGTIVRLEIIPKNSPNSKHKIVSLVRNKIRLEEQAAQKSVIRGLPGMGSTGIGVITIPTFYRDFRGESRGERNFRSTTRDVRRLIQELQDEQVSGIIIDLRQNGGGSLSEATELTGLFVGRGPVVQIKDNSGNIEVERTNNKDYGVFYRGPLAVLVDNDSASASEIFAGAIQDYQRGIIIGEPTFGKGTVQTLIDLSRGPRILMSLINLPLKRSQKLGKLRLTMAQFFRVNGSSTQHRGVIPDIIFPTSFDSDKKGERSYKNAIPWTKIAPVPYRKFKLIKPADYDRLRMLSRQRIKTDPGFIMLTHQSQWLKSMETNKKVSLHEKRRRIKSGAQEKRIKEERKRYLLSQGIKAQDTSLSVDELDLDASDRERKAIDKIQLNEAARILTDLIYTRQLLNATTTMHNYEF